MIPSRAYGHSMRPSRAYEHSTKPGAHAYGHPMLPNRTYGHSMKPSRALIPGARAYGHPMILGFVCLRAPDDSNFHDPSSCKVHQAVSIKQSPSTRASPVLHECFT